MANLMGILGGVGQGISAGVQDLERMEEAKFRKELQQRERERIAEEKRLGEAVKGIQRSRIARTDGGSGAAGEENVFNPQAFTETPRPEADILKEEAAIYAASPDIKNRTLGRQLQGEARALQRQSEVDAERKEFAATLKAITADPNKYVQENLAKFNSDEYGGPGTKGFIAAPMSTPQGTVLNFMGPDGQRGPVIPVNREAMMQAARAMHYDKLAAIDEKYDDLVLKNQRIGLEREGLGIKKAAEERQGAYQSGLLDLQRQEAGTKAPYLAALTNQANAQAGYLARKPTSKADQLKEEIDARAALLYEAYPNKYKNVAAARLDAVREVTKTGLKPGTKLIENRDEGGGTIVDENNKALYNRLPNGFDVPVGVTASSYAALEKEAKDRGVILRAGTDENGNPALRYTKDGKTFFRTIEEARKSKK